MSFDVTTAATVMRAACRVAGLDATGAEPLRWGENAMFRLASVPVVVRIARSRDYLAAVRREVAVSQWLAGEGFPVVAALPDVEQPVVVDGYPVTFWWLIDADGREATYAELGALMRDLHTLRPPPHLALPSFDPFTRAAQRIETAPAASPDDRAFLRERCGELRRAVAELVFEGPRVPVHADAHLGNVVVDRRGRPVLLDLEYFCADHAEWDLMTIAATHDSCRWTTEAEYLSFATAYGRDLRTWPGFPVIRQVQEFLMTTWLMQNVLVDDAIARETATRIASLRGPDDAPRHWTPF